MGIEVFWSQLAENKLKDIFNYYRLKADPKTARKIVFGIINKTIDLDKNPKLGQVEELLKGRAQKFRYLIYSNYKIIYWINAKKSRIVIANIFDTRQNPEKMRKEDI